MPIRAVFFDFGGTLAHVPASFEGPWEVWQQVSRALGMKLEREEIRRAIEETDLEYEGQIYQYHGRTHEFWRRYDRSIMDRLGVSHLREELEAGVQRVFGDSSLIQPYPEVSTVVGELKARSLHLGIISNWHDGLVEVLRAHQLERSFDSVTYSQEVGTAKPDPRVFQRALQRASCGPGDAAHVGDSWEADYLGAKRAGLRAIWLNRRHAKAPGPCEQMPDLRPLPELLSRDPD